MAKKKSTEKKAADLAKKPAEAKEAQKKYIHTEIVDDVFTDAVGAFKPKFEVNYEAYLDRLWESNSDIYELLKKAKDLEAARKALYSHLEQAELRVFQVDNDLHILEKATVREAVRALKSIIGPVNEYRTKVSALDCLWKLARNRRDELSHDVSVAFLLEFINLFRGVAGHSNIYFESKEAKKGIPDFFHLEGREAAGARTSILDDIGNSMQMYFRKYPSGLDKDVRNWRKENKARIMNYFKVGEKEWDDYGWQVRHVIKDAKILSDLIELSEKQAEAVKKAVENKIPFGITPYYLSLMDRNPSIQYGQAVRAQVIPPPDYVDQMVENRMDRSCHFDFMGEHDTSPVNLVTRRYPGIAILKPFNTCAQICVYCQRNWEIDEVLDPHAFAGKEDIDKALSWFDEHRSVGDILITGGDPCIMKSDSLKYILEGLSKKEHIYRIRIGSRTQVVLPMRWTDDYVKIFSDFHEPGRREIAFVTHFEHSYEVTPEAMAAAQKIRKAGMSLYNQEVFTIFNSRRFETAKLRRDLRTIGIDPYYTFNMKGKGETRRYMVPIARILQERKEEARLLPGLDRTDEPVFNVPKLGKNHLRAWQDHRLVMILPNGSRVYEFHPWEKNIKPVPPYNYVDVPIYDYLEEMAALGENIRDYRTIWYYY